MAPVTLSKIATITVGAAGAASINFTNIPQIYTDLKIVMSARTTYNAPTGQYISFNGSTTYHGVLPITSGIRYALNIWMTESDYDYPKIKTNKTLV